MRRAELGMTGIGEQLNRGDWCHVWWPASARMVQAGAGTAREGLGLNQVAGRAGVVDAGWGEDEGLRLRNQAEGEGLRQGNS